VEHIISPAQEALDGNAVGDPTRKILIVRQEGSMRETDPPIGALRDIGRYS
jgi:hypothetical protein